MQAKPLNGINHLAGDCFKNGNTSALTFNAPNLYKLHMAHNDCRKIDISPVGCIIFGPDCDQLRLHLCEPYGAALIQHKIQEAGTVKADTDVVV